MMALKRDIKKLSRIDDAVRRMDLPAYLSACDLADYAPDTSTLKLFGVENSQELHGNASRSPIVRGPITDISFNDGPYGIRTNDLLRLEDKLKNIYAGTKNLEIPIQMLSVLNGDEIITKYLAAGILKKGNEHNELPRDFLELVAALDKKGYSLIGNSVKDWRKLHEARRGDQKVSLSKLGSVTKEDFIKSFHASNIEFPDKRSNMFYALAISSYLGEKQRKAKELYGRLLTSIW